MKQTMILGGAVLVILAGLIIYRVRAEQRAKESVVAFEKLMKQPIMKPGSGGEKRAQIKLDKYIEDFSDKKSRYRAYIKKIELYTSAGMNKEAADLALKTATELDYSEQRAYFYLKAAVLYENMKAYPQAQIAYNKVVKLLQEKNYPKAFAIFGEGRCLVKLGKKKEGRKLIRDMMELKDVPQLDELRIAAAAFLLTSK